MNLEPESLNPLTDADGVALFTRKSIPEIYAMADGGDLLGGRYLWVWNVATDPRGDIRALRFWLGEVIAPKRQSVLSLDQVLNCILPPKRREYPPGAVRQLLQIRHNTLMGLQAELQGVSRGGAGYFYPRTGLEEFFQRRWLGATARRHPPGPLFKAGPIL